MTQLLLPIIYLAFISLGLPDSLLGSAWPTMYPQLGVPFSYAGILSMIISLGTIVSSLNSDRLTRALGPDPAVEADGFPLQWKPGDFLLLCSDGLVNTVTDQEIMFEILHNGQPEDCLQRLMAISKQRGAPDNVTAILLMND